MKKMILLIAALCCAALSFNVLAQENVTEPQLTVLKQDTAENLSTANLTYFSAAENFGLGAFIIGEAVKFTAPKPGWQLKAVQILGWNGFNGTVASLPVGGNFLLEIRDQNRDLLYSMADTQNAYFTNSRPSIIEIEIPSIPMTGDFYVVFYDRGEVLTFMEQENATGNSYFFNRVVKEIEPAQFNITDTNQTDITETIGINWVIRAAGE